MSVYPRIADPVVIINQPGQIAVAPHFECHQFAVQPNSKILQEEVKERLNILRGIKLCLITNVGKSTGVLSDASGRRILSYTLTLNPFPGQTASGRVTFENSDGTEIITCDLDTLGTHIKVGQAKIGVVDSIQTSVRFGGGSLFGTSTAGLGQVAFVSQGDSCKGLPRYCWTFYCPCFSKTGPFNITIDDLIVGVIQNDKEGESRIEFSEDLDVRLKSIVIVWSFMLHNCFWSKITY